MSVMLMVRLLPNAGLVAETVGFEPTKELPLYTLSKRARSTTLPRLRVTIAGDESASSFPMLAAQAG